MTRCNRSQKFSLQILLQTRLRFTDLQMGWHSPFLLISSQKYVLWSKCCNCFLCFSVNQFGRHLYFAYVYLWGVITILIRFPRLQKIMLLVRNNNWPANSHRVIQQYRYPSAGCKTDELKNSDRVQKVDNQSFIGVFSQNFSRVYFPVKPSPCYKT